MPFFRWVTTLPEINFSLLVWHQKFQAPYELKCLIRTQFAPSTLNAAVSERRTVGIKIATSGFQLTKKKEIEIVQL